MGATFLETCKACSQKYTVDKAKWNPNNERVEMICPFCNKKGSIYRNNFNNPKNLAEDAIKQKQVLPSSSSPKPNNNQSGHIPTKIIMVPNNTDKENIQKSNIAGWLVQKNNKQYYKLGLGKQTIGRANGNKTSNIPIQTDDLTMSGVHCLIEASFNKIDTLGLTIIDNESKNGTFINDKKLDKNAVVYLAKGDIIILGKTDFVFVPYILAKNENEIKSWILNDI